MTQAPRPLRQLELPMLSDVAAKPARTQMASADLPRPSADPASVAASARDLSVYDQISQNYFRSLKKS
jgi:hypothetical protein